MDELLGLLRIRIKRGIDLAVRDVNSSDPYVVVRHGKLKLKTRVVKKCLNPEWNEDLTLGITDPNQPIKIQVYDKDTFSFDDRMGDAEIDIKPFYEAAAKMNFKGLPNNTIITTLKPCRENCFAEESHVIWVDDEVVQNMFLRLKNVERGEIEIELRWIHVPTVNSKLG